jgi:hypothetical protein
VRACVSVCVSVSVRACVRVCACARAFATGLSGHSCGTAATGGIYSSACDVRTDTCAFCVGHQSFAPVAAGATWTNRTTSAPWAARAGHTAVIDAAGAIYVIGGLGGVNFFRDVWVSTDGGADQTRRGYARG